MRFRYRQILFFLVAVCLLSFNSPAKPFVNPSMGILRLYATGVDIELHSGVTEPSFKVRSGLGISYQDLNGGIYLYCIGSCIYTRGLPTTTEVDLSLFRGDFSAEGVTSVVADVARGDVDIYDVDNVDVQLGNGRFTGTVFSSSETSVRLLNGDVDLQIPYGEWDIDVSAPSVKSDLATLEPLGDGADGKLSVFVHNGNCRIDSLTPIADEASY